MSVARVQAILGLHRLLLGDAVRNRAFQRALAARVFPGSRVLDIGSGSGLWAVAAARLGARDVVAVEKEPLLLPVIERLARENGVAPRVRVVLGDSRRLDLGRRFDVVISETVGHEGFDEDIVPILADAQRRFLRPGGHLIPQGLALRTAPFRRRPARRTHDVQHASLDALTVHLPDVVDAREIQRVAAAATLCSVALGGARRMDLGDLRGRWRLARATRVDGFGVWVEMSLAPGVRLSTLRSTHWHPGWYGIEPIVARGPLRLSLALSRGGRHWDVCWRESPAGPERWAAYAPRFATGSLAPP